MDKIALENGGHITLEDESGDVLLEQSTNLFADDEGGHFSGYVLDIKYRKQQQEEEVLMALLAQWLN